VLQLRIAAEIADYQDFLQGDSSMEMKREKRDAAGRDAAGKLVRHNGQDVQNLFV